MGPLARFVAGRRMARQAFAGSKNCKRQGKEQGNMKQGTSKEQDKARKGTRATTEAEILGSVASASALVAVEAVAGTSANNATLWLPTCLQPLFRHGCNSVGTQRRSKNECSLGLAENGACQ